MVSSQRHVCISFFPADHSTKGPGLEYSTSRAMLNSCHTTCIKGRPRLHLLSSYLAPSRRLLEIKLHLRVLFLGRDKLAPYGGCVYSRWSARSGTARHLSPGRLTRMTSITDLDISFDIDLFNALQAVLQGRSVNEGSRFAPIVGFSR
jgi:hypothetical protein